MFVIGAGLAGLSAAVALTAAGRRVAVNEAAGQAGGRCRSYHDAQLGLTIDNGNHLVASGNAAVARFRATIGMTVPLVGPEHADFAFCDVTSGERWTVRINDGRIPWWVMSAGRRVPGTRVRDYLSLGKLLRGGEGRVDARVAPHGALWTRLLEPVLTSALNTRAEEGSAKLAAAIFRETIAQGGRAMRPMVAEPTLAAAFIDPAVAWLAEQGSAVTLKRRLRVLALGEGRVTGLDWGAGIEPVAANDTVVLALSAPVAMQLVPELDAPNEFRAIVNAHFAVVPPKGAPAALALVGGSAEWLFAFPDRISVTVSAADRIVDTDREVLARTFWADICTAYRIDAPMPRWQIVKEKRATFAATPEQDAKRPPAATRWRNLFLAGDWTQTGLPATIEGALRSGETAARLALAA